MQHEEPNIQRDLRIWAADHNITQAALKGVVFIINKHYNAGVRTDPRTIMKTPETVNIVSHQQINPPITCTDVLRFRKKLNISKYWHQGLETCLRVCFKHLREDIVIRININIDGLPVHNSTTKCFWPILFNVYTRPMVIRIFYCESKPVNVQEYLQPFVNEIKEILRDGININEHLLTVCIRCFICDSPARAFIKETINLNGKHGYQKCTTIGKYSDISKTTIFPSINNELRTDEKFRNGEYALHITIGTPFMDLPIDMIKDFIVADPLHLLELGIMKRLLLGWSSVNNRVSYGYKTKLSLRDKSEMSELLLKIEVPSEIHRDARTLKLLSYWKGLEFRNFLNYFGVAILPAYLSSKYYEHFFKLFCAVRICSSKIYIPNLVVAKLLLNDFVIDFKSLYGIEYITSN